MDNHESHLKIEVTTNHLVLDKLMMKLGYVLLNWSMLEQAVLDDIKRLRISDGDSGTAPARTRGSFNERLAEWRALVSLKSRRNPRAALEVAEIANEAERLHRIRNLLTHHFAGVEESEGGSYLMLASENGIASLASSRTAFTPEQLDGLISQMSTIWKRIADLKSLLTT